MHPIATPWQQWCVYLPGLGLWGAVEGKGVLNPAIDAAQSHHPLRSAADGESDEGGIRERRLVGHLPRIVVQFLPTALFAFFLRACPVQFLWCSTQTLKVSTYRQCNVERVYPSQCFIYFPPPAFIPGSHCMSVRLISIRPQPESSEWEERWGTPPVSLVTTGLPVTSRFICCVDSTKVFIHSCSWLAANVVIWFQDKLL